MISCNVCYAICTLVSVSSNSICLRVCSLIINYHCRSFEILCMCMVSAIPSISLMECRLWLEDRGQTTFSTAWYRCTLTLIMSLKAIFRLHNVLDLFAHNQPKSYNFIFLIIKFCFGPTLNSTQTGKM